MLGMRSNPISEIASTIEERIVRSTGEVVIKKYTKGRLLGKGGFAKCYEVVNIETSKVSAAKIIAKSSLVKSRAKQKLMSEIKIHNSLHHQNVVTFEKFFEDSENVYMLLELCTNQTLSELIKRRRRLTELETKCYIAQLVEGLKYLHTHRVIHRDLKLGNLFLTDKMVLKIGDFGLATKLEFEGERKRTICGTPNYIAPEILEGRHGHSYEVDIWSLGVILYTLIVGKPPFETQDVKATYKRIKMNIYTFPDNVNVSDEAKSLIHKILSSDPLKRPKLDDILMHPFFCASKIPPVLPTSTLVCPPSSSFAIQYTGKEEHAVPMRLESTGSYKENILKSKNCVPVPNTERGIIGRQRSKSGIGKMVTAREQNNLVQVKENELNCCPKGPDIWIKKWVDYSSKYGLGYLLSNGANGVFFNDSTKIILDPNGQSFEYIERKGPDRIDIPTNHTMTNYPSALQKKVTLLQHFRSYLEYDTKENDKSLLCQTKVEKPIYVKKWLKTKHAIMFRLSNKVVQVIFQDETEIILSSESKMIVYVNKKGERNNYQLSNALESDNREMTKRLKYTKEILTRMLKENQHNVGVRLERHTAMAHANIINQI